MHRRSYYLAVIIAGTSALLSLSSCSLFSAASSSSLALESLPAESGWKEIRADPFVYENSLSSSRVFLTAVKDCQKSKRRSPVMAARQLLVGLRDIRIVEQDEVQLADRTALRTRISAKFESNPLDLVTFTMTQSDCVYDFVLWQNRTPDQADADSFAVSDPSVNTLLALHLPSLVK